MTEPLSSVSIDGSGTEHARSAFSTLVDLIQARAQQLGEKTCFTVLVNGELEEAHLTYGQLDRKARAVAVRLRSDSRIGDRAVLVYSPSTDFIVALYGCFYAGVTAIPVYPPYDPRILSRLCMILKDAEATTVLTSSDLLVGLDAIIEQESGLKSARWIATDDVSEDSAAAWRRPNIRADTLALLQYTSGSTAAPKGVMVTHGNLISNQEMIRKGMNLPAGLTAVSWLPIYHDMGLIGNVLQPLYNSGDSIIMAPPDFLAKPVRWLKAISDYRAYGSGAPSFAYELCARKITKEEKEQLDLSHWKVAYVGAEPVQHRALERFAEKFAVCGFQPEAFYPCYGLAEATLFVAGGVQSARPPILRVARKALEQNQIVANYQGSDVITLTSCGNSWLDQQIVIVDPESLADCDDTRVGEIWVRGSNVARGYWRRKEETDETFNARLVGHRMPFLRTGDLGFLKDGQLFVTGRLKDLIIIRGRNYYPQDIESSAQAAHSAIRQGCGAAFAVDEGNGEEIVLVNEVNEASPDNWEDVAAAVRRSVAEECGVEIQLLLAPRHVVPKTSSGKVQRLQCRFLYLRNELDWVWRTEWSAPPSASLSVASKDALMPLSHSDRVAVLVSHLRNLMARATRCNPAALDIQRPINSLGLDSLRAVEIKDVLEHDLRVEIPLRELLGGRSLAALAESLASGVDTTAQAAIEAIVSQPPGPDQRWEPFPLNDLQQAYCAGRTRGFEFGNIAAHVYLEFEGKHLDTSRLQAAWRRLVDRHDALRTVVLDNGHQQVLKHTPAWELPVEDLRGEAAVKVQDRLDTVRDQMSHQVLPVDRWPLFDMRAHRLDCGRLRLHLSLDLLMVDAASILLLIEEWGRLYHHEHTQLAPVTICFRDSIEQQIAARDSDAYRRSLAYWQKQLLQAPPPPHLPLAKDPSTIGKPSFSRRSARLPLESWLELKRRAARVGLTPSAALLAAYAEILAIWSEQPRFTVNLTMLDRPSVGEQSRLVGQFASFNLLEVDWTPKGSFTERATQMQHRLWEDLDHRHIGGVRSLRELARAHMLPRSKAKMPVVFTPVLRDLSVFDWLGKPMFGISQTPQVWLDNQVFVFHGDLLIHWDAVDEVFPAGVIDEMFAAYRQLLDRLSKDDSAWHDSSSPHRVPVAVRHRDITATESPIPEARLEELFAQQAARYPTRLAVISPTRSLTYQELRDRVVSLASWIRRQGVKPGQLVAVVSDRGWEQVVAILAILTSGAAYVPLPSDIPPARLSLLLENAGLTFVLTQS